MKNLKKIWYKPKEVSELTGIPVYRLRLLADRNPYKVRWTNGRRKFHHTFVEHLKAINL